MTPLELTEVLAGDVGRPRNDGTAGSGLYGVPIGLNRSPDAVEIRLLEHHWDRPPSSTTMHRPGIMRVYSDRVVLDGTTIEEVERYHAKTLKLVIDKTNEDAAAHNAQQEARHSERARQDREHDSHVNDVADRIRF